MKLDISARIKIIRGKLSQDEFAQKLGIHKNSLGRYERGDSIPDMVFAKKLCSEFGVSAQWLLFGRGTMHEEESAAAPGAECDSPQQLCGSEVILIPMVEARVSANLNSSEICKDAGECLPFPRNLLPPKEQANKMVFMPVSGDSMEPVASDGDKVIINLESKELYPGKIYAVGVEDMIFLKTVNAMPGKVILSSYNKSHPPIEIGGNENIADMVRIIGRCICIIHNL